MVSLTHHTVGKWAFQRLTLQCASNSGKVEEKYMTLKPKDSKSFKLDWHCPRNLNCAIAGAILWTTCSQVWHSDLRWKGSFCWRAQLYEQIKKPVFLIQWEDENVEVTEGLNHSLFELPGSRGSFLDKGHFTKPLWWKKPMCGKAVERSHSSWISPSISPNKASKCHHRHRIPITRDKIQAWPPRKISDRLLWK